MWYVSPKTTTFCLKSPETNIKPSVIENELKFNAISTNINSLRLLYSNHQHRFLFVQAYMTANCKKSCNLCGETTTAATTTTTTAAVSFCCPNDDVKEVKLYIKFVYHSTLPYAVVLNVILLIQCICNM